MRGKNMRKSIIIVASLVFLTVCNVGNTEKNKELKTMTVAQQDEFLKIDNDGRLYFKGKPVITEIALNPWTDRAIVFGGFATGLAALFSILNEIKSFIKNNKIKRG
jgi:hypothetical protein